jgi:hypothetical protein
MHFVIVSMKRTKSVVGVGKLPHRQGDMLLHRLDADRQMPRNLRVGRRLADFEVSV